MIDWLLFAALLLGGLGFWLWLRARATRRETGLPAGRIAYTDTGAWDRCERPLFSRRHRLTGKPDYLVRSSEGIIPVEVKSGGAPRQPYEAHVLQLAAYCLLVAEQEGARPPHGIIKYATGTFEVPYTPELEERLIRTLQCMRSELDSEDLAPNHTDPRRCRGCGYREHCERPLA